eukprot:1327508-Rhodomonas_salina.2
MQSSPAGTKVRGQVLAAGTNGFGLPPLHRSTHCPSVEGSVHIRGHEGRFAGGAERRRASPFFAGTCRWGWPLAPNEVAACAPPSPLAIPDISSSQRFLVYSCLSSAVASSPFAKSFCRVLHLTSSKSSGGCLELEPTHKMRGAAMNRATRTSRTVRRELPMRADAAFIAAQLSSMWPA